MAACRRRAIIDHKEYDSELLQFTYLLGECLANHSRANPSKLFPARSALAAFCTLRFSLDSISLASTDVNELSWLVMD